MDIESLRDWANQNQGLLSIISILVTLILGIVGWVCGFFKWALGKFNNKTPSINAGTDIRTGGDISEDNKIFTQDGGINSLNVQGENITLDVTTNQTPISLLNMRERRITQKNELANSGLTQEVQGQIYNAMRNIDWLIDFQSDKFDGDDNLFYENLPISTIITGIPPSPQAQAELKRYYLDLGFSSVEFGYAKGECKVILS